MRTISKSKLKTHMLQIFRQIEQTGKDPADRTIVATATLFSCPLITSDLEIRSFYANAVW